MYSNHGEDSHEISVIDCSKDKEIIDTIDINSYNGPHDLALDQENRVLYVSVEGGILDSTMGGGIIRIDLNIRRVVKAIGSGHTSHWFVMTPDGKKAYTCNKEAGFISVIDLIEERMVGKIDVPGGCEQPGISNDGRFAFFPSPQLSMMRPVENPAIQVVDTTTDKLVKSIALQHGALCVHVDSQDRLLVGQYRLQFDSESERPTPLNGQLLVLSSEKDGFTELGKIEVEAMLLTMFSSTNGKRAFVSNIFSGTVTVVDMTSLKIERTIEVDTVRRKDKQMHQGAHGLALVP